MATQPVIAGGTATGRQTWELEIGESGHVHKNLHTSA